MKTQLTFLMACLPLTLALQKFTAGNNLFAASVYKEIKKTKTGNFLVSPFSAGTVLALAQSGAKDQTAQEIRTGLNLPDSQDEIESSIKSLQPDFNHNDLYKLRTANKIYIKNDFEIKDGFKKIATEVFNSSLENVDFNKNVQTAESINQWVEEQTEHKIKNLVQPGQLNDRTRAILVNALYFKGNWIDRFKDYATSQEAFYRTSSDVVQVDTMHDTEGRNFYEDVDLGAKFLELPFKGGDVSMTIILPNEKDGLAALEGQLERVLTIPNYTIQFVKTSIPKFKIESRIDFKTILQQLGVKKAFQGDEADFSGMAGEKGDLFIDEVIQKTFINVNEEGVEAAAATFGVGITALAQLDPTTEFKADHPFIFYIKVKDLIIFAGRVTDPSH